jgi:hypothetical protein
MSRAAEALEVQASSGCGKIDLDLRWHMDERERPDEIPATASGDVIQPVPYRAIEPIWCRQVRPYH